jgi:hypothetical protein
MSHDHSQQRARRHAVILYGRRNRNRQYEWSSKNRALTEALSVLGRADADCEVWSRRFQFEGDDFLLSTIPRSPREVAPRLNGIVRKRQSWRRAL